VIIPDAVREAAEAAGRHLVAQPVRMSLAVPSSAAVGLRRAIYLAYARDGALHYVGKVDRGAGTVSARITEHVRTSPRKRSAWRSVWVVPITDGMSSEDLLVMERALIRRLRPPGNIQHSEQRAA
jgi:hypothetical protein